jgi:hypothetical protein
MQVLLREIIQLGVLAESLETRFNVLGAHWSRPKVYLN